jgi:hypothetical protein
LLLLVVKIVGLRCSSSRLIKLLELLRRLLLLLILSWGLVREGRLLKWFLLEWECLLWLLHRESGRKGGVLLLL